MSGGIPQATLDEILSRIDIVEVISSYIPLKRAGRNFKTTCPFHHEKSASFMVNPVKQIFHCFGCGVGGNVFNFLMRYERVEFPEAVEQLAKKAGVLLPKTGKDARAESANASLYKINELAALFYNTVLKSSAGLEAKKYLLGRGITNETVETFKLGLAPAGWDGLLEHLRAKGIPVGLVEKSGLIISKQGGGYYDRFRSRIIFPIFDIKNRIIAFGGRVLPGDTGAAARAADMAKYINSPETPVYVKGKNLFGLNLSKEEIAKLDYAVIVEGYLDFVIPYQHGIRNLVASQGTALTSEQARLMKRYSHNVVVVFDGDAAGELATLRSLDIFIEEEMNVRVASLPQGFDPDTCLRKYGETGFREIIESAKNLFDYKLDLLKSKVTRQSLEAKVGIAQEMLATIAKIKNAVLKSEYIRKLADDLSLKEDSLLVELKKIKPDAYRAFEAKVQLKSKIAEINPTEKLLLYLMLEEAKFVESLQGELEPADFEDARASRVVSVMFDHASRGKTITANQLINYFSDDDMVAFLGELLVAGDAGFEEDKHQTIVDDCVKRLKSKRLRSRREELMEEIKTAQASKDDERVARLMHDFHQLTRGGRH